MNFYKRYLYLLSFIFCLSPTCIRAAEWQWSTPVTGIVSKETNANPQAFLWIPPNCKYVKGVVIGQHNMLEEGILEHRLFRENLAKLGLAEIWITPAIDFVFNAESWRYFDELLQTFAGQSGYRELAFSPIIPIGHSAAASYPWNFAAFNPNRTLAILSIHGDAPLTNMTGSGQPNPNWGDKNIDGIPALFVMGEYEWLEGRIAPAMQYRNNHPNAPIALFCDAGRGHFDFSDDLVRYLNLFIAKAVKTRFPKKNGLNQPPVLTSVNPKNGWLIDRWRKDQSPIASAATYSAYQGNKEEAGWAFDGEMALATAKYYEKARGKAPQNIVFIQNGKVLPPAGFAGFRPKFIPLEDGISFHLSASFVDPIKNMINSVKQTKQKIDISRICGPVIKVNDSTFKISFYRMGFNNPKRSNDIWLMATNNGNTQFKSIVQQANLKIPITNNEGRDQHITFPNIPDQKSGKKKIRLLAQSDANVPVQYYVKEGPAEVIDGVLRLTKIPPNTKMPIKVTIVAWQYGYDTDQLKIKSATPIERSFQIYEK